MRRANNILRCNVFKCILYRTTSYDRSSTQRKDIFTIHALYTLFRLFSASLATGETLLAAGDAAWVYADHRRNIIWLYLTLNVLSCNENQKLTHWADMRKNVLQEKIDSAYRHTFVHKLWPCFCHDTSWYCECRRWVSRFDHDTCKYEVPKVIHCPAEGFVR